MPFSDKSRPPTHAAVELSTLLRLAGEIQDAAGSGPVTPGLLEDVAADQGVPRSHLYAAAAVVPDLSFERRSAVRFVVCAGGCQQWGALERLEQLLQLREGRIARGEPPFDVHPRACLDRCDFSPVLQIETGEGIALLPLATAEKVAAAIEHLFEEG
jgi:NADH:ubiquinone oxidoreductase subunit E